MSMSGDTHVDRATIRLFWRACLGDKPLLLLGGLHSLGTICITTMVPLFMGKAIAALIQPNGNATHYLPYIAGFALVGLVINRIGFRSLMEFQARTMGRLQVQALDTLLRRSVGFHNDNVGGKLVSDAIDYPNAFNRLAGAVFNGLVPFGVIMLSGSIVILLESWQLGLFISVLTFTIIFIAARENRRRAPLRMARLKITKRVTSHLADTILNIQTVKTFAREKDEQHHHEQLNRELTETRVRDWRSAATSGNNRIGLLLATQFVFVVVMIYLVQRDPSMLSIGIFAFSFTMTLSGRLFEVNILLRTIEDAFLDASPMTKIILETPEIQDKPNAQQLQVTKGEVNLKDVTFQYQDNPDDKPVFSELSLTIKPGEKVGLVGPSGGGKSTLTRLLLRFDDIDSGVVEIDGQDIAGVTQASLRRNISYVPQEPLLFHRTVHENIAYGKPEATLSDIQHAAKLAHADTFINELSDQYETIVGERGVKLSGGQRQRIAIARAILKNAPILILDEATSALDSESEVLIQDALWKLMQKRTALVIAHRLSTIQKMDRIVVLEGGRIAEQGTHRQLLRKKGLYAQLWAHQSGGFIEE